LAAPAHPHYAEVVRPLNGVCPLADRPAMGIAGHPYPMDRFTVPEPPGTDRLRSRSRPMTMPDLARPDVTPALPSLDWSAWSNLAGIWRGATIPNVPGLYRVRRIGAATIDYIGQTGAGGITLRRDVTMLRASIGPMLRRPLGGASFPHHRSATIKSRHATVHETVRCRLRNCLQYGRYTAFQSGFRCRDDTRPQV
jgi:hypothetical protein